MSLGFSEADRRKELDMVNLRNANYFTEGRPNPVPNGIPYYAHHLQDSRKVEYTRSRSCSRSQGPARRLVPAGSYVAVLLCLAASLLILPLILPPLPPPPLMLLLLLPIGILGMLMVLAFMPSNDTKEITSQSHTYM